MKIIAVSNSKGGVAKTTTTIHLGAALSKLGSKVLIVDFDPQGHIVEGFGISANEYDISDVIEGSRKIADIINPAFIPHIAPSTLRLADMELTLVNMRFRETKLKNVLEPIKNNYDYILIDCPPNLGMLTINALMAATDVIIPMTSEYASMLGVASLIKTVYALKAEANPTLNIMGIINTRVTHTIHAREVLEKTNAELKDIHIFKPLVYESVKFKEAFGQGKTLFDIDEQHKGAEAYLSIAKEINEL